MTLKHGVPSHDTFSRVFRMLDPQEFEKAFRRFMQAFAEATPQVGGIVALDGKSLKRAYERGKSHMPPLMVTAWSAQTRMALANVLAPGNNEANSKHLAALAETIASDGEFPPPFGVGGVNPQQPQQQAPQGQGYGGGGACVPSGFARLSRNCSVNTGGCQRMPDNCNRGWCCP